MLPVPQFEQKKVASLFSVLAYLGAVAIGLWLLYRLQDLIPPLLVAAIIALTLAPEIDRLERQGIFGRRIRRGLAIGVIYILFLAICAVMIKGLTLVSVQMTTLITQHFGALLTATPRDAMAMTEHWMQAHHVPKAVHAPVLNQAKHAPEWLGNGLKWFGDNLPALVGNLVWVVIVPIIAFFLLLDFNKILGKILLLIPKEKRDGMLEVVTDVIAVFGSYVRGVLTVMILDICVIFAVLWCAGLREYALPLAVTAGMLYTIPYIGALISTVMIGLVALTHGLVTAIVITLIMIFIHQIVFDTIVAPRIIGGSVHLHPLLTLIALMAGGTLYHIGGALLAVPIAAAAQVILVHLFPQFKTDVMAVRRAAHVVQATISKDTEVETPPARKAGNEGELQEDEDMARAAAQGPPPVLPGK